MKRKKFWIGFSITIAVVLVLIIVGALVFKVKTVDVEFRSRVNQNETNLSAGIQAQVENYFKKGKNILFYNTDSDVLEVERNIPYVKVEQVIKYFPNNLRVYISERIPRFRVQDSNSENSWYILDIDFKVLDKVTTDELTSKVVSGNSNYYDKTIEIDPEYLKIESYIGEFVTGLDAQKNDLAEIVKGIYGDTKDISTVLKISKNSESQNFELTMKNSGNDSEVGGKILIVGTNNLKEMVFVGIDCYNEYVLKNAEIDQTTVTIRVEQSGNKYKVFLVTPDSEEEIENQN